MNYEDQVIKSARQGLAEGFTNMTPEMERLMRLIYRAGYNQAQREQREHRSDLGYSRVGLNNV